MTPEEIDEKEIRMLVEASHPGFYCQHCQQHATEHEPVSGKCLFSPGVYSRMPGCDRCTRGIIMLGWDDSYCPCALGRLRLKHEKQR